ncbi:DUF6415 family natural product biosynthesis protein [Streptomyces sp. NPDC002838]|uniref:DUF6415 family natural product biosynthesis protein n=1 Tax=Streptomyces sp. NPDC002838 TaxID=3154436 RepID=UPI00332A110B
MQKTGSDAGVLPLDVVAMRATAHLVLGPDDAPDALPPAGEELDTLTGTLRGHLELIAPEVERAAKRLHKDSIPRYCALACVGEARGKLQAKPNPSPHGPVAYARRLARVLNALCDHHENLREGR